MGHYTHSIERGQGLSLGKTVEIVNTGFYPLVYWENSEGERKMVKRGTQVRDKRTAEFHAKSLCREYQRHFDRTGQRRDLEEAAKRKAWEDAWRARKEYRRRIEQEGLAFVELTRLVAAGHPDSKSLAETILDRIGPEVPLPPKRYEE